MFGQQRDRVSCIKILNCVKMLAVTSGTSSESETKKAVKGRGNTANPPKKRSNLAQRFVTIENYEFTPKTLHVQTGFKVTWVKPVGSPTDEHAIKFIGEEDKEAVPFKVGGNFTRVFISPGAYEYYCERHVFMRGEIIVEGSQGKSSAQSVLPTKPIKEAAPSFDATEKYQEYASKRESTRQRLAEARIKRDLDVRSETTETKDDSPRSSTDQSQDSTTVSTVRFGSFDSENDFELGKVSSQDESTSPILSPSQQVTEAEPQVNLDVQDSIAIDASLSARFDYSSAVEFLSSRWKSDVQDVTIKWI